MIPKVQALNILDRFIYKAARVNKPYKAIKKTDAYQAFQGIFKSGISDQVSNIISNLPKLFESAGIRDNLQPLTLEEEQKLKGLVARDMPALSELVSEFKVFSLLKDMFEWGVKAQYKRNGIIVKADPRFELTNPMYISKLRDNANYLLQQSALDQTTIDWVIGNIATSKLNGMTNDETAAMLEDGFSFMSDSRAELIARTESANALGQANLATMVENGVQTKQWVTAGGNPCEICQGNEDDGDIPVDSEFSSGDDAEPAHPNCECYTEANEIDLDSIDIWGGE